MDWNFPEGFTCKQVYQDLMFFLDDDVGSEASPETIREARRLQWLVVCLMDKGIMEFSWTDLSLYAGGDACNNDYKIFPKLIRYERDKQSRTHTPGPWQ